MPRNSRVEKRSILYEPVEEYSKEVTSCPGWVTIVSHPRPHLLSSVFSVLAISGGNGKILYGLNLHSNDDS